MPRADHATLRLFAEEGEGKHLPIATVAPVAPVHRLYAFAVPQELRGAIAPGQRVRVPFGRGTRKSEAFVLEVSERPWHSSLQFLNEVLEPHSRLTGELLDLGRWISRYYSVPLGPTLAAMVPAAVRHGAGRRKVRLLALGDQFAGLETCGRLSPGQRRVLDLLQAESGPVPLSEVLRRLEVSSAVVRGLIKKGWIQPLEGEAGIAEPAPSPPLSDPGFELNDAQRRAVVRVTGAVDRGEAACILLHGVSGSGKTEVYIQSIRHVTARGGQAIVLVPEIALTTQLVQRLTSRLPDVAVLHSGLTEAARSRTWHAIAQGRYRVVIGTRSAVFAPCHDLRLMIIDEEQEGSFKNQQAPRYHAREVAAERARMRRIPLLLGSATPSLETWYAAHHLPGREVIELPERVAGLQMPEVELVDMRDEVRARPGFHLLSRLLDKRLADTLARGEQAVLLLNRRGYAGVLYCPRCRQRVACQRCRASMVFHRALDQVVCHHCHVRGPVPRHCADPGCGGVLVQFGMGVQRAEEELRRKYPTARIERVDSDTMNHLREYQRVIHAFEERQIDILIGTQIIAKGLDFPFVSLVGVISADVALHVPDFRANEITFQLVTQVAGRAGRAHGRGRVVVQTIMSDLPALQAAVTHDYAAFAAAELHTRRLTGMPPFSRLARWVLSDPVESRCIAAAQTLADQLRAACAEVQAARDEVQAARDEVQATRAGTAAGSVDVATTGTETTAARGDVATTSAAGATAGAEGGPAGPEVIGPHPAPLERQRGRYRFDLLLRTRDEEERAQVLDHLRNQRRDRPRVQRIFLDVDPITLM